MRMYKLQRSSYHEYQWQCMHDTILINYISVAACRNSHVLSTDYSVCTSACKCDMCMCIPLWTLVSVCMCMYSTILFLISYYYC